jgi:hypothetical protein
VPLLAELSALLVAAGAAAAAPAPAAPAPAAPVPPIVRALVCSPEGPNPDARAGSPVDPRSPALSAALAALAPLGVHVAPVDLGGACQAARGGLALEPGMPDLVVAVSWPGVSPSDSAAVRAAFRVDGRDVRIAVLGRTFSGRFTSKALVLSAPAAGDPAAAGSAEIDAVTGLAATLAYRKLAARRDDDAAAARLAETARQTALPALARADTEWLAGGAPVTAAVLRQLRASLLFDAPCGGDSPLELLRSAARLVPYSAEARTLAAVARLKEAYEPSPCPLAAEQELFESLELDPWNDDAADNLGLLYELSVNAQPDNDASRQVSARQATQRLERVWKEAAPRPPWALEIGVGTGVFFAKANGSLAPAVRVELGFGRDGRGFGARLGLSIPWTREIDDAFGGATGSPSVTWTRLALDVGPRYRLQLRAVYGEIGVAGLATYTVATGHDFNGGNETSSTPDVGVAGSLRIGRRFGRVGLWAGASALGFRRLLLRAGPTQLESDKLPQLEIAALVGVSGFLWR